MSSVLKIKSARYNCDVFFTQDNTLLLLPTFFSLYISRTGQGYSRKLYIDDDGVARKKFELEVLSHTTIRIYENRLHQFLNWLSEYDSHHKTAWLSKHNNLPQDLLNKEYIDDYLIMKCKAGRTAISHHESALQYYYNYLCYANLSTYKHIHFSPKYNVNLEDNTRVRTSLKYLSRSLRLYLYENASSLRDEILLRNGGELGLRTSENLGLLLNDFEFRGKKEPGLKALWREMKINKDQSVFRYLLQGKFSKGASGKGGKSREIFIPRPLLRRYQKYFERERPHTDCNTLLVNNAANAIGTAIKKNKGSNVFADTREKVMELQRNTKEISGLQALERDHTYHCLRHSFATDKFEEFCKDDNLSVPEASDDSRAFLRLARLMGHSIIAKTTARYIQLVLDKQAVEKVFV